MPEYDFGHMQEEAVRRAREMQSRARIPQPPRPRQPAASRVPGGSPSPAHQESPKPESGQERENSSVPQEPPHPEASLSSKETDSSAGGVLENLFQDKERTIILALLILLSGEEGNHELLFALLFLLM